MQPYGIKENPHSILDVADIVYVNPVNTGFSRPIPDAEGNVDKERFFGVQADITYLAEWLSTFVTRKIDGYHQNTSLVKAMEPPVFLDWLWNCKIVSGCI